VATTAPAGKSFAARPSLKPRRGGLPGRPFDGGRISLGGRQVVGVAIDQHITHIGALAEPHEHEAGGEVSRRSLRLWTASALIVFYRVRPILIFCSVYEKKSETRQHSPVSQQSACIRRLTSAARRILFVLLTPAPGSDKRADVA